MEEETKTQGKCMLTYKYPLSLEFLNIIVCNKVTVAAARCIFIQLEVRI